MLECLGIMASGKAESMAQTYNRIIGLSPSFGYGGLCVAHFYSILLPGGRNGYQRDQSPPLAVLVSAEGDPAPRIYASQGRF